MGITNPKLFGLDVNRYLADVTDKNTSLFSLNLPPPDLDVIRGSRDAGATFGDWISLSRLTNPLYKTLDRYSKETSRYTPILSTKAGTNITLFGNLNINGRLSGSSIRFRYVDGTGPSAIIKIADISTSRVSAWSSVGVGATVPISYGSRVGIITGGQLQFGTQSSLISGPRLRTTIRPQVKEFDSELPTHRIQCTIDGKAVNLYAMKGIPVVFTGFFRNVTATIQLTSLVNNIPPSWKVVDVSNTNSFANFRNAGSTINYRATLSRERNIQFYYNPDNISSITINSAGISRFPETIFQNLSTINLSFNNLVNFPNLTFYAPSLQNLYFKQNPFYLSETQTERTFNSNIITKIPTTVKILDLGGTFYGSIPQNLIADRLTTLTELYLSRINSPAYFHPDSSDPNCSLPNVPNTCEVYDVSSNDFRAFGTTDSGNNRYNPKDLTNLISLSLANNGNLTDNNFSITSTKIQSVNISNTRLSCPDLGGRVQLTAFSADYNPNVGSLFTGANNYKFNGCNSLRSLTFYASPLTGTIPKFTNSNITYIDLRNTSLSGGDPDGNTTYVIPEKTFEQSPKLQYFLLQSGNLIEAPIHPNAFSYTPELYYFWHISGGKTTGNFPNFGSCPNLTFIVAPSNSFSGLLPNFSSNRNIQYVDLSYNLFSGTIPGFRNLTKLNTLYIFNNNFTSLSTFSNLPNLQYFYAHNNSIGGRIPNFGDCPNLIFLILFNNKFTDYVSGSFSRLYRINYIDLSNNNLSQQAINSIIADLVINYNAVKRGGVTVNLRNNALPSGIALERITFLRSKGWTITYE